MGSPIRSCGCPFQTSCRRTTPRQTSSPRRLRSAMCRASRRSANGCSGQCSTGPTLPSFLLIKYGLFTGTVAFLYLAATRIFRERGFAILVGLSLFLLFQFAWNLHEGVKHSMVLNCAVAASWVLMRITENGRASDHLLFGLIVGLGLISKWGFAGFLVLLLIGAMLQPSLRARLLAPRVLLSLCVIAVISAPVVYWLIVGEHDLVALYDRLLPGRIRIGCMRRWSGLSFRSMRPLASCSRSTSSCQPCFQPRCPRPAPTSSASPRPRRGREPSLAGRFSSCTSPLAASFCLCSARSSPAPRISSSATCTPSLS